MRSKSDDNRFPSRLAAAFGFAAAGILAGGYLLSTNVEHNVTQRSHDRLLASARRKADDPREVDRCHKLGRNDYVSKPVDFHAFAETLRRLGLFISVMEVPAIAA
jgi:hypothetical protein